MTGMEATMTPMTGMALTMTDTALTTMTDRALTTMTGTPMTGTAETIMAPVLRVCRPFYPTTWKGV